MGLFGGGAPDRDEFSRSDDPATRGGISTARITIWIVVGAIGCYLVVSGVIGGLTAGA
ncbi:MAG: hypothetical protein P0Y48_06400 [Candidatus Microbacterium phytovorans]|uniref:Uncharacterized protein n=1 Tax=Candidatus Microbacterium phytovorans TaxID=3121374 RepID=A0AAJ5W2A8_9MICO|nr:hypothetical protein [Microbacterium sp.]WEK14816.1 MAG: hypothetical protein P0Y48_06400 [Microbacterium sp.]